MISLIPLLCALYLFLKSFLTKDSLDKVLLNGLGWGMLAVGLIALGKGL